MLASPARSSYRGALHVAAVAAVTAATLLGCGGGSKDGEDDGPRFIIASQGGLSELSGGKETLLVRFDDNSYILDPAVSPDGRSLAFARQPPAKALPNGEVDFGSDLYLAGRDGGDPRELVHHASTAEFIESPIFLPGGKELAFVVRGRGEDGLPSLRIEAVDLETKQRRRLVEDAILPSLSPDGKTLAFVYIDPETAYETPSFYDLAGGDTQPLPGYDKALTFLASIVWSPDGERIAFAAADPNAALPAAAPHGIAAMHPFLQDVWIVNRDGSNLHRLIELAETRPSLAWSADGDSIYALAGGGFWRIDVAGGRKEGIGQGVPLGQIYLLGPNQR